MSDMIKIDGKGDSYIIVLDPGDNVVGPDGFTKHNLQWGNKSATAWSLPVETVSDEEDSEGSSEVSSEASLFSVKAYAEEESGVLVGAGLGYFLDKLVGTAPIMLIVFLVLGGAAGFLNVYRYVKKEDLRRNKKNV